ncbi:MAG: ParB N-terminal domain-containing protein [Desulfobacterales bacterium]|nr:ParB N-terminal domain-containing protein [Desulfobacterales bacterium]
MENFFKNLFGFKKNKSLSTVKSFNDAKAKEDDCKIIEHGIQNVSLDKIVGSVGKYKDFDSRFHFRNQEQSPRFNSIKQAMLDQKVFPPINLYQIRDEFYILDGNHRVAAAKSLGRQEIEAKVTELISSKKNLENLLYMEKSSFLKTTNLPDEIELTEVGKYRYLEKQIKKHLIYLETDSDENFDLQKAARDWYDTIYIPLTLIIKRGGLLKYFPNRTISDLYVYVSFTHWRRKSKRKYGIELYRHLPGDMESFRRLMLEKSNPEYPEMKRSITAFVFINVKGSIESRVVDKIFKVEGVSEVHSVHGNIDILIKIKLIRDLLASDAETIGEFVDKRIRSIQGVDSTQTIIPAISKVKDQFDCTELY